ncbi:hypothetical protein D5S17_31320 [Pseudonocardiaceae bacterium YIM PH 21723]|nr:hypothetical protein D5S17_31320 [Pseudonocardiaceae bacterium YIM PH 21723]
MKVRGKHPWWPNHPTGCLPITRGMELRIDNPEAERLAWAIAAATGESPAEALATAVFQLLYEPRESLTHEECA